MFVGRSGDTEHPPDMNVVVVIDEVDVIKEPPGKWALSERVYSSRRVARFAILRSSILTATGSMPSL
jgi:hypothetical protein